jgi:hypothetical protein
MSGSFPDPDEVPGSVDVDLPRPQAGVLFAERWAHWWRDPRVMTAALALVALAAGAWWVRLSVSEPSGATAKTNTRVTTSATHATATTAAARASTTTVAVFVVDVVGAVHHAGVVSLPASARVIQRRWGGVWSRMSGN